MSFWKNPLLSDSKIRLYLSYRLLVTLAVQMQSVGVAWQVYDLTKDPLHLGYVGLAIFLPNLLCALPGGRAADRYPRRHLMAFSVGLLCLASLGLFITTRVPHPSLGMVYGILTCIGIARSFGGPATSSYLPQLVASKSLAKAIALNSTIFQMGTISGPALGGLLLTLPFAPLSVLYAICSLFLAIAFLGIFRLPFFPSSQSQRDLDLWGGLRFVWQQKLILGALSLDLFAVLLGGAVALLPMFAKDILAVGPSGLGLMRSAPSVGALVTAIILASFPPSRRVGHLMFASVFLFGVFTIFFGLSQNYYFSLFCLAMIGATDMVSVVIRQTLVQIHTPEEVRGRVNAVNMISIGASNELGEFESGLTAAWLGPVAAVVFGGVGTCLIVLFWAFGFPSLRKAEKLIPNTDTD